MPTQSWDNKVALDWNSNPMVARGLRLGNPGQRLLKTHVVSGKHFHGWQVVSEGSAIQLRDPNGRLMHLSSGDMSRRTDTNRDAYINGGAMVLARSSGDITLVDLYKLIRGQAMESVVWTKSFSGDGTPIAVRRSASSKFGDPIYRNILNAGQIPGEFRLGTMLDDRFFVAQGGDLMAIDLATSKTIWRNSTAPRTGPIVSDNKRVAAVSSAKNVDKIVFYDPLDGAKLGEKPWEHGEIWTSSGRHILCYAPTGDPLRESIRLVDPFTGQVKQKLESAIMNRSAPERGYGQIINGRYMVLLDTQGNLTIWDINSGAEICKQKTPAYDDLLGVHATVLDGQMMVFPWRDDPPRPVTPPANGKPRVAPERVITQQGDSFKTVSALYAISLSDGEIRWKRTFDDAWGCTLAQPSNTPLFLLMRSRSKYTNNGGARISEIDAMAIDVRDGNSIHERIGTRVSSRMNELTAKITVQPTQDRVIAKVGGEVLTYKFGETDPEPTEDKDGDNEAAPNVDDTSLDDLFG